MSRMIDWNLRSRKRRNVANTRGNRQKLKKYVENWRNRGDMKENGNKCEQKRLFSEKIKDRVSYS